MNARTLDALRTRARTLDDLRTLFRVRPLEPGDLPYVRRAWAEDSAHAWAAQAWGAGWLTAKKPAIARALTRVGVEVRVLCNVDSDDAVHAFVVLDLPELQVLHIHRRRELAEAIRATGARPDETVAALLLEGWHRLRTQETAA